MISEAVIIKDVLRSSRVRLLPLRKDIPLAEWTVCPACLDPLKPIALLCGVESGQKIRYGLCERCGYMGYMDRPKKDWMVAFYTSEWDQAFPKTIKQIREGITSSHGLKPSRRRVLSLVDELNIDRTKPVCEIGCGYGEILKLVAEKGFIDVIGVENSAHRARAATAAFGFPILTGNFENDQVQRNLRARGPFGLIISHHVFEHTYDPAEIIMRASALQEEGDHLILAMPNAHGEHINYGLLYLVHLHSFTPETLERMLNRFGYEVVKNGSPNEMNLIVAARKVGNPVTKIALFLDYRSRTVNRIRNGLALRSLHPSSWQELYWEQRADVLDYARITRTRVFIPIWRFKNILAWSRSHIKNHFSFGYTMLVKAAQPLYNRSVPVEIHFPHEIKFLAK